jgi:hypothetical protein
MRTDYDPDTGYLELSDEKLIENISGPVGRGWRSICDVHREIYQKTKYKPTVVKLLIEAYRMGKKMDAKLRWYKQKRIIEKGDGFNKAAVWIDEEGILGTTCFMCDESNKTTELCEYHSLKSRYGGRTE